MKARIGYFIPEFPGQTHIFFWREMAALESMGIEIDIVSTKRPLSKIMSHTWTLEAQQRTTYLFPPSENFIATFLEILRSDPGGWFRCLWAILRVRGVTLFERLRLFGLAFIGAELSYLARSRGWQHLHVHSCADAANVAMFSSLISKLPYSLTLHGPIADYGPNQEQKWRFAAFGIVITKKLYGELNRCLASHLPQKVEIAPMGVDCSNFNRKTAYSPWNGNDACRIFSCGRLNFCKGHADLITVIYLLKKRGFNAYLEIAGEDEQGGDGYRKELEKLIEQLSLKDCVHLLGAVSEDTVKESIEKAHVFVLASLHEPLGVAIMEAMAMELPVVVTGSGGVKELVDDGVDGILVPSGNPDEMADAITKVLQNKELALSLSKESRKKILAKFHHQRSAEVLVRCLKELTQTPSQVHNHSKINEMNNTPI